MSRYIDADLLLSNLIETAKGLPVEDRPPYLFCALLIDEEGKHSANVEEIVFCKDCVKHNIGRYDDNYNISDTCPLTTIRGKAQGHEFDYQYCSYGKRKGGETE